MTEETTRFQLSLHGISLELSGERAFVDEMYREIMRDIEVARARMLQGLPSGLLHSQPPTTRGVNTITKPLPALSATTPAQQPATAAVAPARQAARQQDPVIWVHRCSDLVHKIYMASPQDLRRVERLEAFQVDRIHTLYVEDGLLGKLMPQFDRGQTLWAELTREGRKKIAEAGQAPSPPAKPQRDIIPPAIKGSSST